MPSSAKAVLWGNGKLSNNTMLRAAKHYQVINDPEDCTSSSEDGPASNSIRMFEHNATQLRGAIGGS